MRNLDSANAEGAKPIALCILDDSDEGPRAMPRQKSLNYTKCKRSLESTHTPCLVEQTLIAPWKPPTPVPLECVFSHEGPL